MSYYQSNTKSNDIIDLLGSTSTNTSRKVTITSTKSDTVQKPKNKKKKVDQLKAIVRVLDDRLINPKDFTVSPELLKELQEIIENIHTYQSKAKHTFKEMNNFCGKKDNEKNLKKTLRHHLEGALQEIERYTDKLGEICDYIAGKYLRRLCRIMKRIESCHCNGFVPMDVMMESIDFVNRLVELLNNKSARVGEFSDVSTIDPLFGKKCCTNFSKEINEDPECSDDNENILLELMLEQMNPGRIDLRAAGNYPTTNEKYINRLINEHKTIMGIIQLLRKKMTKANIDCRKNIFKGNFEWDDAEAKSVDFDKVTLTLLPFRGNETNTRNLIEKTKESETYKKIRNNILNSLKTTETSSSYIKNKVPIVCPCTFFKHERSVEKTLTTYIEFFRFGKYMWSYVVLKGIANELTDASFAKNGCRSVKDLYFKDRKNHNRCTDKKYRDRNIKYFFTNTLFQKYFGDYIHDDGLYDSAIASAPAPVSTFTPIRLPSNNFSTLLKNDASYGQFQTLMLVANLPETTISDSSVRSSIQEIVDIYDIFKDMVEKAKDDINKIMDNLDEIYDQIAIYNDDTGKSIAERNDAVDESVRLSNETDTLLQNLYTNTFAYSFQKMTEQKNEITAKHGAISDPALQPHSKVYTEWVVATLARSGNLYQICEKVYPDYAIMVGTLSKVSFGTTTPKTTGLLNFGGIFGL